MSDLTETELLTALEALLKDGRITELWFDEDSKLFWAGEAVGHSLREALQRLVTNV